MTVHVPHPPERSVGRESVKRCHWKHVVNVRQSVNCKSLRWCDELHPAVPLFIQACAVQKMPVVHSDAATASLTHAFAWAWSAGPSDAAEPRSRLVVFQDSPRPPLRVGIFLAPVAEVCSAPASGNQQHGQDILQPVTSTSTLPFVHVRPLHPNGGQTGQSNMNSAVITRPSIDTMRARIAPIPRTWISTSSVHRKT